MPDPYDHPAGQHHALAPYCSDPETTLRPGALMVVSMKPYGAPGKIYPQGRDERRETPGLHRWYDGPRRNSNFVHEADRLLRALLDMLDLDPDPRQVFSTYAYFTRATDAAELKSFGLDAVDCSDYHRELLKTVQPRVVLCIGNGPRPSAYATYKTLLRPEREKIRQIDGSRARVKCFDTLEGIIFIGVPHLSYHRAETILPAIQEFLGYYLDRPTK